MRGQQNEKEAEDHGRIRYTSRGRERWETREKKSGEEKERNHSSFLVFLFFLFLVLWIHHLLFPVILFLVVMLMLLVSLPLGAAALTGHIRGMGGRIRGVGMCLRGIHGMASMSIRSGCGNSTSQHLLELAREMAVGQMEQGYFLVEEALSMTRVYDI